MSPPEPVFSTDTPIVANEHKPDQEPPSGLDNLRKRRAFELSVFEVLELIVVSISLALLVRHYVFEPFVIPTGSMAPAYFGEHCTTRCRNCSQTFAVNVPGHIDDGFTAECQICGYETQIDSDEDRQQLLIPGWTISTEWPVLKHAYNLGGDKIVVDKTSYHFEPVQRFDVVVFKYPKNPFRNFLKRIVGLPGERIGLKAGDIYVNGEILRKPEAIQNEFWQTIYDQRYSDVDPKFQSVKLTPETAWTRSIPAQELGQFKLKEKKPESFLLYDGQSSDGQIHYTRQIRDHCSYNAVASRRYGSSRRDTDIVADLKLTTQFASYSLGENVVFNFIMESDKTQTILSIALDGSNEIVLKRLHRSDNADVDSPEKTEVLAKAKAKTDLKALQFHSLEFSFYDRQAIIKLNEKEVIKWLDPTEKTEVDDASFSVQVQGAKAIISDLKVSRDIYYYHNGYPNGAFSEDNVFDMDTEEYIIPQNCYLGLGDNQTNSSDSRDWGFIKQGHLIGRAKLIFGSSSFKFHQQ